LLFVYCSATFRSVLLYTLITSDAETVQIFLLGFSLPACPSLASCCVFRNLTPISHGHMLSFKQLKLLVQTGMALQGIGDTSTTVAFCRAATFGTIRV
jgi:hypothetical protein